MNESPKRRSNKKKNNLKKLKLTNVDFAKIKSVEDLRLELNDRGINFENEELESEYDDQLKKLQIELIKLQGWIIKNEKRVVIIFEGRDASGKGSAIKRFTEHLNTRAMRVIALAKPTELEKKQWYFMRYIKQLSDAGEIVFFDRSWYNRAVVEPVMEFCTTAQYELFMRQVSEFEHMLLEDGVILIKFWFSVSKEEHNKRFSGRLENPLKTWKFSPVDELGQSMWKKYTYYKEQMFSKTHNSFSPWIIVKTDDKKIARIESIRHLLTSFEYEGKEDASVRILPDPNVIMRFHHSLYHID